MKRILGTLLTLAAAIALVLLPGVTAVQAQCTNATLTGNYGFTFSGFQFRGNKGISLPWQGAGLISFDGAGNASGNFTFSLNGQIATSPYTGTYTVNPDCTGSLTATPGSGGDNATFVVVGGAAEAFAVDTSTYGVTMTLDLKKQ